MEVLHKDKEMQTLYVHKERISEDPPFKNYTIEKKEIKGNIEYITIRRVVPLFVHILFALILVTPMVFINYKAYTDGSVQKRVHTIRVPSTMYWDNRTNTIDVDVINDSSNLETISIELRDKNGKLILQFNGIKPGESIGSVPISEYKVTDIPISGRLIYKSSYNEFVYNEIEIDVLIVDRRVAEKEQNNDF